MYQYVHGGDIYSDPSLKQNKEMLDYSANINPLGIPAGVARALKNAVTDCVNYPDPFCRELRAGLSRYFSLPAEMIYCGNGAADVLFRIMAALRPKRTLVLAPTFADYEKAAVSAGSKIDYFTLHEKNEFAVTPEILKAITKRTEMVVLCNPNNPTGAVTNKETLVQCICEHPNTLFVVDASYAEYTDQPLISSAEGCLMPNVLMLHSMTKDYGLPGLRLGYVTGSASLLEDVRRQRMPWSVNQVAIDAANYLLSHQDEYTINLRMKTFSWAVKVYGILFILTQLTVYGTGYLLPLLYFHWLIFPLFIGKFYYEIWKFRKEVVSDEE